MSVTLELQPVNINKTVVSSSSRFNFHAVYRLEDGTTFLQSWRPPNIRTNENDKTLVINLRLAYRPDLVSDIMYGTPLLGWAICYVNDILNPLDRVHGLYPGRLVVVPDISTIYGVGI